MSRFAGFSSNQLIRPKRSDFDLSHFKRSSTRAGRLTPVFLTECIPGDTFHGNTEILLRLAPLLAPIYDDIQLFVHFFFVPNRLLWEAWEEFITGGRLGVGIDPVDAPIPPYFNCQELIEAEGNTATKKSSLADYLGVPDFEAFDGGVPSDFAGIKIDAMPFMVYHRCVYDWYRDRNFVSDDNLTFPYPSGELDTAVPANALLLRRATRAYLHDYFTSSLPFTQRGIEVMMPVSVSGDLPVYGNPPSASPSSMTMSGITQPGSVAVGLGVPIDETITGPSDLIARLDNISSATSINDFRSAFALQVWYERNALGGSRYVESNQVHFGVKPQDARLQNAEFLGGGRIRVTISEIVSTAYSQNADDATVPLANMGGHGKAYGNTNRFHYFCPEHGFIIGIASIMSPPSYHNGLPRMFRRRSFLDYPWPTFAKLGEQQVDKAEIFASAANLTEDPVTGLLPLWGYQSRYADWKCIHNTSHGEFHDTLMFWTLAFDFGQPGPELGEQFVTYDDSIQNRIFAVNDASDNFWMYIHNNIQVTRCLPYFGAPNNLGFA